MIDNKIEACRTKMTVIKEYLDRQMKDVSIFLDGCEDGEAFFRNIENLMDSTTMKTALKELSELETVEAWLLEMKGE